MKTSIIYVLTWLFITGVSIRFWKTVTLGILNRISISHQGIKDEDGKYGFLSSFVIYLIWVVAIGIFFENWIASYNSSIAYFLVLLGFATIAFPIEDIKKRSEMVNFFAAVLKHNNVEKMNRRLSALQLLAILIFTLSVLFIHQEIKFHFSLTGASL